MNLTATSARRAGTGMKIATTPTSIPTTERKDIAKPNPREEGEELIGTLDMARIAPML